MDKILIKSVKGKVIMEKSGQQTLIENAPWEEIKDFMDHVKDHSNLLFHVTLIEEEEK